MSTEKTPQQQDYESRVYDEMLDGFTKFLIYRQKPDGRADK